MAPDKIYVNIPWDYWHPGTDKKVDTDTEYVRKDALLEWAKEKEQNAITNLVKLTYKTVIEKIESL